MDNPIGADLKYKGKDIILSGFVTDIELVDQEFYAPVLRSLYDIRAIARVVITFHDLDIVGEALFDALALGLGDYSGMGSLNCWIDPDLREDAATLLKGHYVEIEGTIKGRIEWRSPNDVDIYPCFITAQSDNDDSQ